MNSLKTILEIAKTASRPNFAQDHFWHKEVMFRKLGCGCSRLVYEIHGTPWVIKFGFSVSEIDAILALRSNPTVRPYLPGLIWFNEEKTVSIMLRYEMAGYDSGIQRALSNGACRIFRQLENNMPHWMFGDLHEANVGVDAVGRLKVIDCGNFSQI